MQMETISTLQPQQVASAVYDPQLIKVEEIRNILYLGIKGKVVVQPEEEHTVDTFA